MYVRFAGHRKSVYIMPLELSLVAKDLEESSQKYVTDCPLQSAVSAAVSNSVYNLSKTS